MSKPRRCLYVPPDSFDEGHGYVPSIVEEGKPGHTPLRGNGSGARPWYFGMTYEAACQRAEQDNLEMGITPEDARQIILSSIALPFPGTGECARCADTGADLTVIPNEAGRYCRGCVVDLTGRDPES